VFESGRLHPDAIARTVRAVVDLATRARSRGASRVFAVGTEALRRAANGRALLTRLAEQASLDRVWLLSGEDEARLGIEAIRRVGRVGRVGRAGAGRPDARAPGGLVVVDVGGGSTEISRDHPDRSRAGPRGESLPVGSVRLTERYVTAHPIGAGELADLYAAARAALSGVAPAPAADVVAVAGTATTLAALELELASYDADRVEGARFTRVRLGEWIERLAALSVAARRRLAGLEPERADVIVAGLVALDASLEALGAPAFRVSGRGLRWGVALQLLDGREPAGAVARSRAV
jgi:exopolyphosphatase/guanosine-5'-triphosphate,3'-diphosphate pyrophosphatase